MIDATFSFDGVIGAFAITSDPLVIAMGLGVGALYVRSLTVHLVRRGSLKQYVYLEHGAQWAIGALAVLLLLTVRHEVPQVVTGLVGVGFIGAALIFLIRNSLIMFGVDANWYDLFVGLFIIFAVLLERVRGRKSG